MASYFCTYAYPAPYIPGGYPEYPDQLRGRSLTEAMKYEVQGPPPAAQRSSFCLGSSRPTVETVWLAQYSPSTTVISTVAFGPLPPSAKPPPPRKVHT